MSIQFVNNMGSRCMCTRWMYQYWWWFNWTETCRWIYNIDYQYMLCYLLNKLLYYCKHNGMATIKAS